MNEVLSEIFPLIAVAGLYIVGFALMGFASKSRPSALPERYRK